MNSGDKEKALYNDCLVQLSVGRDMYLFRS